MQIDPYVRIDVLSRTEQPQTCCWWAMHQDYCEEYVFEENPPTEDKAGELLVKHLLAGERGHYGPLEHPSITFAVGWFPHSVMQQARTHRVGVSFDVQSGRYTGQRVVDVLESRRELEEVFYFRPIGTYRDRQGKAYEYDEQQRTIDRLRVLEAADSYGQLLHRGYAEEHAREMLPYCIRQHFVVTFNLRSLMHFLDLRAKRDAQYEIQVMCKLLLPHFEEWAPQIASWYETSRLHRARLAP